MRWIAMCLALAGLIAAADAAGPPSTLQTTTGASNTVSTRLPCAPPMFLNAAGACICPPQTYCPPPCPPPKVVVNGRCVCPPGTYPAQNGQCFRCPPPRIVTPDGRCECPPRTYPLPNGGCSRCPPSQYDPRTGQCAQRPPG